MRGRQKWVWMRKRWRCGRDAGEVAHDGRGARDRVLYRGEIAKFSTGVHILTASEKTEER